MLRISRLTSQVGSMLLAAGLAVLEYHCGPSGMCQAEASGMILQWEITFSDGKITWKLNRIRYK